MRRTVLLQTISNAGTSGSGTAPSAGQVAYWVDANTLGGFGSYSSTTNALTLTGTLQAGAIITAIGVSTASGITPSAGNVILRDAGQLYWNNRSTIYSDSDGTLRLTDFAGTTFGRLIFGGTTGSFPALKRSSTTLAVRLADDSADAPLSASTIFTSSIGSSGTPLGQVYASFTDAPSTGNQTQSKMSGSVYFSAGVGTLTVTNTLCTSSSKVFAVVTTSGSTGVLGSVIPASGSFAINMTTAPAGTTRVNWFMLSAN